MEKKHYEATDGLRTIAPIRIVMMLHIAANNKNERALFMTV